MTRFRWFALQVSVCLVGVQTSSWESWTWGLWVLAVLFLVWRYVRDWWEERGARERHASNPIKSRRPGKWGREW